MIRHSPRNPKMSSSPLDRRVTRVWSSEMAQKCLLARKLTKEMGRLEQITRIGLNHLTALKKLSSRKALKGFERKH